MTHNLLQQASKECKRPVAAAIWLHIQRKVEGCAKHNAICSEALQPLIWHSWQWFSPWHMKSGMTRWKLLPLKERGLPMRPMPFSPAASKLTWSAVMASSVQAQCQA